ncbi:MAG: efflux RND transporter periplasmic adaptor subunit [Synergistaceae bacterium]|nr:efflux RND transporter periplasmic adaptor subunit [Synergistaceae bacterium]
MKKFYFTVTFVTLVLSAAFMGYGMYLNITSASHIETMLASRAVSLSGSRVLYRDLYPELRLDYIDLRPRMQADVITQIDGEIEELYVTQGQSVERDQPIGRIVNYDVPLSLSRADADVAKAESAYLYALRVAERNQRLAAEDAISTSDLETSVSQMEASRAELDAARVARRQIEQQRGFQVLTAPLSGSIPIIYRQPGNFVDKGTPIALVVNYSNMYFNALVNDEDIQKIAPLDEKFSLRLNIVNMLEKAFDGSAKSPFDEDTVFNVEISDVSPPLGENAAVRRITCEVDNHLGIVGVGVYGNIVILKETAKRALAIPLSAVSDLSAPSVHVRDADSKLAVRPIRMGVRDDEYVEVAEGLEEGDVVILSGVEGLDLGTRIDVFVEEDIH